MWLMTTVGFLSAVSCRKEDGVSVDPDRICIRARSRHHLLVLKEMFPEIGAIQRNLRADYRYRVIVEKQVFVSIVAELAWKVNYTNFKGKVSALGNDPEYERSLHEVWETMYELQLNEPIQE